MTDIIDPEAMGQLLAAIAGRSARLAPEHIPGYDADRAVASLAREYDWFKQSEVISNVEMRLLASHPQRHNAPDADCQILRDPMTEQMHAVIGQITAD